MATPIELLELSAEIKAHLIATARKDYILACDRRRSVLSQTLIDAIEEGRQQYRFAVKEAA
jgi:hypothetical protein